MWLALGEQCWTSGGRRPHVVSGEVGQEAGAKESSGLKRGARPARPCWQLEHPGQRARVGLGDSGLGWGWLVLRLSPTLTGLTVGHVGSGVTEDGGAGLIDAGGRRGGVAGGAG